MIREKENVISLDALYDRWTKLSEYFYLPDFGGYYDLYKKWGWTIL